MYQRGREGVRAPRARPRARRTSSATRTSSRCSRRRGSTRGAGRALQGGRRALRRAGGRAPRRLPDVRLRLHGVERGEDGPEARRHRRAGRRRPRRGDGLRPLHRTGPSTGGSSTAGRTFDSDVSDPRYAGLYGPARSREKAEDQTEPPDPAFLDDWLARTGELVDKYQPQLVWFDWWIAQPAFQPNLQTFAAFYYNRGAEWGKGVAINYKKHGGESFPDTAGVLDIERGQLAEHPAALLADRHLGLEDLVGLRHEPRLQDRRLHRRRPGRHRQQERRACSSTSGRGRTARSPSRRSRCCGRSARGST